MHGIKRKHSAESRKKGSTGQSGQFSGKFLHERNHRKLPANYPNCPKMAKKCNEFAKCENQEQKFKKQESHNLPQYEPVLGEFARLEDVKRC